MDPNHDWKSRFIVMTSWTGDIQVEALEFVLLKHLFWNVALGETDEFFFETFLVRLWAYWGSLQTRNSQMITEWQATKVWVTMVYETNARH